MQKYKYCTKYVCINHRINNHFCGKDRGKSPFSVAFPLLW